MQAWIPMKDPHDVRHLVKLIEELGELTSAASRCLNQGIDERNPETGKSNKRWLQEEIADVLCQIARTTGHFDLNTQFITDRVEKKHEAMEEWTRLLKEKGYV